MGHDRLRARLECGKDGEHVGALGSSAEHLVGARDAEVDLPAGDHLEDRYACAAAEDLDVEAFACERACFPGRIEAAELRFGDPVEPELDLDLAFRRSAAARARAG